MNQESPKSDFDVINGQMSSFVNFLGMYFSRCLPKVTVYFYLLLPKIQ